MCIYPHPHSAPDSPIAMPAFLTFFCVFLSLPWFSHGKALFILGDSTVDVGNNNHLVTSRNFKADYPPYGRRFFDKPTGRFSEGRVFVDFLADYAGLPFIPPYADCAADFSNGANFGSGGAGILSETNQVGKVIDLKTQLAHFVELQKSLSDKMGVVEAKQFFAEAVYVISIGSNDYMGGYLANPAVQQMYPPEQYVAMVVGNFTEAISFLYSQGARKVAYLGLGPLGCLPGVRISAQDPKGGCLTAGSALAQAHNRAIAMAIKYLQAQLPDLRVAYANFFDFLSQRQENPASYGFKEPVNACCGSGLYGGLHKCGGKEDEKEDYDLCSDANERIWWDSFHPSELIHEQFAEAIWSGSPEYISPFNVHHLFDSSSSSLCSQDEQGVFTHADLAADIQASAL